MKKSDYRSFARKHLQKWDLGGFDIVFNGRMKRAIGRCKYRKREIHLSSAYFVDHEEKINTELLKDVVLHEISHALDFKRRRTSDHSWRWKEVAREVGADPTRLAEMPSEVIRKVATWKRECPKCGWEKFYHSKPHSKRDKVCPECHNKYDSFEEKKKYVLEVKRN
jgi:predicted SprT family Zn-dependent metalloprotease